MRVFVFRTGIAGTFARRGGSPLVVETLLAAAFALAVAIAFAAATAATEVAATAATEVATTAAAAAEATAATAAEATTTAATAAELTARTETAAATAAAWTRSAGLSLVHDEGATLEVLAIESFDRSLTLLLRTHGDEAEATGTTGFTIGSDEHIQHLAVSGEDLAKSFWRRTVVEISDKDLEHVWPPRPGRAMRWLVPSRCRAWPLETVDAQGTDGQLCGQPSSIQDFPCVYEGRSATSLQVDSPHAVS